MGVIVVLLGGPGSGKSTVAAELAKLGFRWRDWEVELLRKWGGRDAFLARKEEALSGLWSDILAVADEANAPLVIESTGISDAPFLDRLRAERPGTLIVRLDIEAKEALRRIAGREAGQHLADGIGPNQAAWQAYDSLVRPHRRVDLAVDSSATSATETAQRIHNLIDARPRHAHQ